MAAWRSERVMPPGAAEAGGLAGAAGGGPAPAPAAPPSAPEGLGEADDVGGRPSPERMDCRFCTSSV